MLGFFKNNKKIKKLENLGYEILDIYFKQTRTKKKKRLIIRDKNKYKYDIDSDSILETNCFHFVSSNNPFTLENIQTYLSINNKKFDLVVEKSEYARSSLASLVFYCHVCKNEFSNSWNMVNSGKNCPICSGRRISPSKNFAKVFPKLEKEWDYSKNNIDPYSIHRYSGERVWWVCSKCLYEYSMPVRERSFSKKGCQRCAGKVLWEGKSFGDLYPELLKEWDYDKNTVDPFETFPHSNKRIFWKCDRNHCWDSVLGSRTRLNRNCPVCGELVAGHDFNLEYYFPEILSEWNYERNGDPKTYTPKSNKKVSWICSDCGFEWVTSINHRTGNKSGCPQCARTKNSIGEKMIKNYLEEKNMKYISQAIFEDCLGLGKRFLPFDFCIYLDDKNYFLCEFQGVQHYEPIEYFGGETEFEVRKVNDKIKKEYCFSNNIDLLEISYKDKKRIPFLLDNYIRLKKGGAK